jgi:hypothetical protein
MGYTNDTAMCKIVPLSAMTFVTGAWSDGNVGHVWSKDHTPAAETATIRIPIAPFQNSGKCKGSYLKSIDIWYSIATAAITSLTPTVYRGALPPDGSFPAAPATLANTFDSAHDSNAKRVMIASHRMTLILSTPIWLADTDLVFVELSVGFPASSVFKQQEARLNFTLRC